LDLFGQLAGSDFPTFRPNPQANVLIVSIPSRL